MKKWNPVFASLVILCLVEPAAAFQSTGETADVAKRVQSYIAAFNHRDVTACTEHWSESAEYNVGGAKSIVGRKAIGEALKKLLATDEEFELSVSNQRLRSVSDTVVMEDGVAQLVSETHGIEYAQYLVVHVKQNGKWYRDSIRETLIGTLPASNPNQKEMESLVGTWNVKSDDGTMSLVSNWMPGNRFISRSFEMNGKNGQKTSATEIVGWDPSARIMRSWSFDSQGGFEQAVWNRDGEQWLIKANAVLPGGNTATEQRMLSVESDGNLVTQVIEQQFGGRLLPGSKPVTLVRESSKQVTQN